MLPIRPGALLTINEVSKHLGVSQKTVRRWVREGKMPPWIDIHGQRRWRSDVIIGMVALLEASQRGNFEGQEGTTPSLSGTSLPDGQKASGKKAQGG